MPADWDYWQLEEEPPVDPVLQAQFDDQFDEITADLNGLNPQG